MTIEGRGGREDDGACLGEGDDVPGMDEVPGGLPGNDNQLAALLEEDVGGPEDQILTCSRGNAADRSHGTGHHDHSVEEGAATGKGGVHRLLAVLDDSGRQLQFADLLTDHLLGVGGENQMDLMVALPQVMEQPLEVNGAAGSCGC